MKGKLVLLLLAMLLLSGCTPTDALDADVYTHSVFPAVANLYDLGAVAGQWNKGYFKQIYLNGDLLSQGVVVETDPIYVAGGVPKTRTVNGKALSADITLGLASSDFANQGTTTTVLHGNAIGNPSFGSIVTGDISDSQVTYAKIQNVSLSARLLGRNSLGAGIIEELDASTTKTMLSLNNVENTALSTWAGSANITTLGTIGSGTWHGGIIASNYGGTGVGNNVASTLTISGNFATTLNLSGITNITLPTTGTLATTGDIATHAALTSTHGVAGSIVGTTDTQTLSSKTLTTPVLASFYQDAGKTLLLTVPGVTDTLVARTTADTLTNKTLNASVAMGTWTASGTWTIPAVTLGGIVSAGTYSIRWGSNSEIYDDGTNYTLIGRKTLQIYTLNASSVTALRLQISNLVDTAVATWTNITHSGIVLSGALNTNNQAITNALGIYGRSDTGHLVVSSTDVGTGSIYFRTYDNVHGIRDRAVLTGGVATANLTWADVTHTGIVLSGNMKYNAESTGAGATALGSNCPAVTPTAVHTWLTVLAPDGDTVYIPAWK